MEVETGGKCTARGASGERGCFQFMKGTWDYWSKHVFGYIEKMTPVNEYYVALHKIQYHINQGYDDGDIARIWNQGNPGPCVRGTNSHGVPYDSCSYERKVLAHL